MNTKDDLEKEYIRIAKEMTEMQTKYSNKLIELGNQIREFSKPEPEPELPQLQIKSKKLSERL